ncbi:MAG: MerR family transcriptional regulator [Microbacterium sp. SCN 70-27]|uniref:MerR family transcriptional regulator n=1 Tax=unclassified Microbacterium TaxID=2609290 RepID=UPI00086E33FA|nr:MULTISPECIES: MerR family transcriptional regulator [unclassified Microbacterium]MBN9224858.1 MerR family transcriptional regulator [Microbacterium sp.]ODT27098.1 MAG: MerR family transcriptional regulator [Microbacterium sp. SCN 70-27]
MTLIHEPRSGIPIAEAAEISGVSTHTLRYYERAGLMLTPVDRASSSHRRYSPADLSWVAFLTRLRMTGMPIAGIRRYTELAREGASTIAERRELLVAHREHVREELADITASLRAIDDKIDIYDKEIS